MITQPEFSDFSFKNEGTTSLRILPFDILFLIEGDILFRTGNDSLGVKISSGWFFLKTDQEITLILSGRDEIEEIFCDGRSFYRKEKI